MLGAIPRGLLRLAEKQPQIWRSLADQVNHPALQQDLFRASPRGTTCATSREQVETDDRDNERYDRRLSRSLPRATPSISIGRHRR